MGTNPLLANALDLDRWADTLESRGTFPELMRRLLEQTPGVTNIDIRAHEGTAAHGWDGTATSDGSPFLPKGELRFEFGTNKQPKTKADDDYQTRAEKVTGKSDEIFVFATPRNWAGAASWAKKRRQEGVFASVEAYDVHRLEGWLQSTPAVHYWISEQIGKPVSGAQTLTSWWEEFQGRLKPKTKIPAEFHIAGREEAQQRTIRLLEQRSPYFTVQASWCDDALSFLYAAFKEGDVDALHKTLVVHNADAWQRLTESSSSLILVPLFEDPNFCLADRNGHTVIRVLGGNRISNEADTTVVLPKIRRDVGTNVLLEMPNIDSAEAYALAGLAVRNMATFYQSLSRDRVNSGWAQGKIATKILAPLVLVGAWEASNSDDLGSIAEFIGVGEDEINEALEDMIGTYSLDPPFVMSGGVWRLVDPLNAAKLLLPRLTEEHLVRWGEYVQYVLLCEDTMEGLSFADLILAQLRGEHPPVSSDLREYSARGLALAAATCDAVSMRAGSVSSRIDSIVANLLNSAFQDDTGRVLLRLSSFLPFLAEASPSVFLEFIETDLSRDEPVTACLFRREKSSIFGWSSSIHDLLFALECLCWSRVNFGRAARLQVKLANLAPDNKDAEVCLNSSEKVLVGWAKLSAGYCDDKVAVLKWALEEYSNIGWQLLGKVLLAEQVFPVPYEPVYRDWQVEKGQVSEGERDEFVRKVLIEAVCLAECAADRWMSLLGVLDYVSQDNRSMLIDEFRNVVNRSNWKADELLEVYLCTVTFVCRQQTHPQASRALSAEELQAIIDVMSDMEPCDDPRRFAWLFTDEIEISIDGLAMWDSGFSDALREKRDEAIVVVLSGGLDQLSVLVYYVNDPYCVGQLLADFSSSAIDSEMLVWLEGESSALRQAAIAYIHSRVQRQSSEWACSILKSDSLSLECKQRFVAALPADKEYWEVVGSFGDPLVRAYWENISVVSIKEENRADGVGHLLEQGLYARAINLLGWMLYDEQDLAVSQVVEALSRLGGSSDHLGDSFLSYNVAELLKWLEQEDFENSVLPVLEFKFFDYLFRHEPSKALYHFLGNDPDNFVSLVQSLYSTHDKRIPEELRSVYKQRCWSVLNNWQYLPGLRDDGSIDGEHLLGWVNCVRTRFNADSCERDYDGQIGEVLSCSPDGKDGMWPAEEVRVILETLKSSRLEAGMIRGRLNRRGVTSRGVFVGGRQENAVADSYWDNARKTNARSPRTAAMHTVLAQEYERDALREDTRAERRGAQD